MLGTVNSRTDWYTSSGEPESDVGREDLLLVSVFIGVEKPSLPPTEEQRALMYGYLIDALKTQRAIPISGKPSRKALPRDEEGFRGVYPGLRFERRGTGEVGDAPAGWYLVIGVPSRKCEGGD